MSTMHRPYPPGNGTQGEELRLADVRIVSEALATRLAEAANSEVFAAFSQYFGNGLASSSSVDQNQTYSSNSLLTEFLRESGSARLLMGADDPAAPGHQLLPTLRDLILHHVEIGTVFRNGLTLIDAYTGLVDGNGMVNEGVAANLAADFMGTGLSLGNNALDQFVAGGADINANGPLAAMHTVWARNHNFHVDELLASGFAGSESDLFLVAKMLNEADYQRVVFTEFADHLIGDIPALHEQLGRMQQAAGYFFVDTVDDEDFYEVGSGDTGLAAILARNSGLTGLPEDVFSVFEMDVSDADIETNTQTWGDGGDAGDGESGGQADGGPFLSPSPAQSSDGDYFVFNVVESSVMDVIDHFDVGDKIDVSSLMSGSVTLVNGDAGKGEIGFTFEQVNGEEFTVVRGNLDSDVNEEFTLYIRGHHNLTGSNFV